MRRGSPLCIALDRYFFTDFLLSGAPILFRYTFPLFDEPILMITQIGRQVPLRLRVTCNRCWERFWNSQFPALTVIGQGTYGKHKFVHSFPPPNLGNKTFTFRNTCARIRDLLGTRTAERQEKAEMNAQGRWFASSFSTRKGSAESSACSDPSTWGVDPKRPAPSMRKTG